MLLSFLLLLLPLAVQIALYWEGGTDKLQDIWNSIQNQCQSGCPVYSKKMNVWRSVLCSNSGFGIAGFSPLSPLLGRWQIWLTCWSHSSCSDLELRLKNVQSELVLIYFFPDIFIPEISALKVSFMGYLECGKDFVSYGLEQVTESPAVLISKLTFLL